LGRAYGTRRIAWEIHHNMNSKVQNNRLRRIKLIKLIQQHQNTKKNFEIQDAYKLIYQSVFGIRHILDNLEKAKNYLQQEFESINADNYENLIEKISVSGEIVRLNLRPFKYRNGNSDRLSQAMLLSAEEIYGSAAEFLDFWNQFKEAVFIDELNFDTADLSVFDHKVKSENYPSQHHSAAYRAANRPAYRVLKSNFANQLISF
jgi:hypothetical protein